MIPASGCGDRLRDDYVRRLEDEVATLRERVAALGQLLHGGFVPPLEWDLTVAEAGIIGVLMTRAIASKEAIMVLLYGDRANSADTKICDIFVCKIRRKLAPYGITIETAWGRGWWLAPETKARIRTWIASREVAA